jgi:hypothetical protein
MQFVYIKNHQNEKVKSVQANHIYDGYKIGFITGCYYFIKAFLESTAVTGNLKRFFNSYIKPNMNDPIFLIVDLFCGFGGTTTGFVNAELHGNKLAKIIACVNHDPKAIKSHWLNHPDVKHFEEDIRTLDLTGLVKIANHWKTVYPDAYPQWQPMEHGKGDAYMPNAI